MSSRHEDCRPIQIFVYTYVPLLYAAVSDILRHYTLWRALLLALSLLFLAVRNQYLSLPIDCTGLSENLVFF